MEVGYWVTETRQGEGLATEMLSAAKENPPLIRVLEKQNFQVAGEKELPTAKGVPLNCFSLELRKH